MQEGPGLESQPGEMIGLQQQLAKLGMNMPDLMQRIQQPGNIPGIASMLAAGGPPPAMPQIPGQNPAVANIANPIGLMPPTGMPNPAGILPQGANPVAKAQDAFSQAKNLFGGGGGGGIGALLDPRQALAAAGGGMGGMPGMGLPPGPMAGMPGGIPGLPPGLIPGGRNPFEFLG